MFHAHIAIALELMSMAVGSLLIMLCCWKCCTPRHHVHYAVNDQNPPTNLHEHDKPKRHFSFFKIVGYFVVILSFAGLICTSISLCRYWSLWEEPESANRAQLYDEDFKIRPIANDQYRNLPPAGEMPSNGD